MRFFSGKSTCVGCGRPLDVTDDWIPIPPWEAPDRKWTGFYHRECLALLPWWADAVARWRTNAEAQVRSRSASTRVIARAQRFLLVYGSADNALELFYLGHMARQRFRDPAEWTEFAQLIRDAAASEAYRDGTDGEFQSASEQYAVRLVGKSRAVVRWGVAVRREMDFAKAEYERYAADHGPLQGFVDFPAKVAAGLLHPVMVDGELAKNRGVVIDVKPVKEVYVVTFDAPRLVSLDLMREEFADLVRFLAGVKLDQ